VVRYRAVVAVDVVGARWRWRRAVVGWLYGLADYVGLSDPGALRVREDDGDGVAAVLESPDEGEDVGGGLGGGRTVVVCYLVGSFG
jgi:hypothetical protein